ncbi:MAG: NusG domain II-containing protein [Eubacterium sp.]|nr:NusG domain II-containing protein [Eubacterium sp.]
MKKADFILIAVVLFVVAVLVFVLYGTGAHIGAYVTVEVDGTVVETLPLDKNTTYEIKTAGGTNTLVIDDGFAYISEADCPDKICVHHRKINKSGESIICLPHKVIVTVSSSESAEVDL